MLAFRPKKPGELSYGVSILGSLVSAACLLVAVVAFVAVATTFFSRPPDANGPSVLEVASDDPRAFAAAVFSGYLGHQSLVEAAGHFGTLWWRWQSVVLLMSLICLGTIPAAHRFEIQNVGGASAVKNTVRALILSALAVVFGLLLDVACSAYVTQIGHNLRSQQQLLLHLSPADLQSEAIALLRTFRHTYLVLLIGCAMVTVQAAFLLRYSLGASWFLLQLKFRRSRRTA